MTTDEQLTGYIRQALLNDGRLAEQPIEVSADDGVVTLSGTVQSHRRKLAAQELASSFEACRGVENELEVVPAPQLSDDEIARLVRSALKAHADITKETIAVAATNGVVTLSGNVSSYWERTVAEDVALATKGARAVTNLLLVDMPGQIEDEALAHEIKAALSYSRGLQDREIQVAVDADVALLSGQVDALWKKEMAERVTRRFRVKEVRNEIRVTRP
jgi:osmotically-inducible protein OsmY